jgi:NAD(P)-dependent dehydrogenase (short-subunit alcohol dehydrogenase family)
VTGGSSGIGKATAFKTAAAGATTIIVGRDPARLEAARDEAVACGLDLVTWTADLTDPDQCRSLIDGVRSRYGSVDVLVNNAGRSIRRGIEHSFDRMHDFERMMAVNYFGALRLTLGLLPAMAERGGGHVINISSIGVLTNAPRFSAYVASKAALEAWTRCAASEFLDRNIAFTTINMPLVRTPMISPSHVYDDAPTLTPEEAAGLVVEAIVRRPVRIATSLGIFGQMIHAVSPRVAQVIMNTAFRMVPDTDSGRDQGMVREAASVEQIALKELMRGIHL